MPGQSAQNVGSQAAFELKGSNFAIPVLRLLSADVELVSQEVADHVQKAPEFFQNAPLIIDLSTVQGQESVTQFALLVGLLRSNGLMPVGVRGGSETQNEVATSMDLAVMAQGTPLRPRRAVRALPDLPRNRTKLVTQPVRSGQRVYGAGSDLVVLAPVSSGAEVFADGHIHIYGALRGRALAGVKGDTDARIFCQGLDAELVSIAGHYRVSDDLDHALRGKPAQLYLERRRLRIEPL
jgi:septum site-determining protein MinC